MSNTEQNKLYFKKHYNDGHKGSNRISSSRLRNRSRSRSRSKERTGKYNTSDYFSQRRMEKKQSYQRPKDSDNYYQQTTHNSTRSKDNDNYYQQNIHKSTSHIKNWKKDRRDERKHESELIESSKLEETKIENISNIHDETDKDKNIDILTEAEMNKLGAKIVKAEIMGDNVCYYIYTIIFIIYYFVLIYFCICFTFIRIFSFT